MKTLNGMKIGAIAVMAFAIALGGFASYAHAEIGLKTNADIKVDLNNSRGRGNDNDRRDDRRGGWNDNDKKDGMDIRSNNRLTAGTVTAINGSTITIKSDRDNTTYAVVADGAKIYQGSSAKTVADIKIGDTILVDGSISGTSILAIRILNTDRDKNIPDNNEWKNFKSGIVGEVTAVNGNILTVSAKSGTSYTVNTSGAKLQKEQGVAINLSDIKVGDSVLIQGSVSGTTVTASNVFDVEATAQKIEDRKDNGNHYGFFHRLGLWFGGIFKAKGSVSGNVNLNGSTFRLASYNGAEIPAGQNYLLSFNDGRLGIKFCNSMGGDYSLSRGTIKGQLVSTMMFCSEPANVMTYESTFGKILGEGAKFTQSGSRLTIKGNAGETFVFNVFMD